MKSKIKPICLKTIASGRLDITVLDKTGRVKHEFKGLKNMILNNGMDGWGGISMPSIQTFYTYTSTSANYDDLAGTWQVAAGTNTLTRASGSATPFASGTAEFGRELRFADGTRCHITSYISSTSVGLSKTFASGVAAQALRRFFTNVSSTAGSVQSTNSAAAPSPTYNATAGTWSRTWTVTMTSATSAYSLGSVQIGTAARVVLSSPVAVAVDDQIQMSYTVELTVSGRATRTIALSSAVSGWPFVYKTATNNAITSITGSGTYFDVTTQSENHFLAGDTIILNNIVPKRFAIASGSSTATHITVNTAAAHGLSPGSTVVIENASVGGYNGTHTVDSVTDADTFVIASALNPGALGASGTVRLATPVTYFGGTWTVASKPANNVCRVTSAITGPAVDSAAEMTSTDSANFTVALADMSSANGVYILNSGSGNTGQIRVVNETNVVATPATNAEFAPTPTSAFTSGNIGTGSGTSASYSNDWTASLNVQNWNAGTADLRCKQIMRVKSGTGTTHPYPGFLLTLHTAQPKLSTYRLTTPKFSIQTVRDLP